jgi:preprotein translocase subunit SecG
LILLNIIASDHYNCPGTQGIFRFILINEPLGMKTIMQIITIIFISIMVLYSFIYIFLRCFDLYIPNNYYNLILLFIIYVLFRRSHRKIYGQNSSQNIMVNLTHVFVTLFCCMFLQLNIIFEFNPNTNNEENIKSDVLIRQDQSSISENTSFLFDLNQIYIQPSDGAYIKIKPQSPLLLIKKADFLSKTNISAWWIKVTFSILVKGNVEVNNSKCTPSTITIVTEKKRIEELIGRCNYDISGFDKITLQLFLEYIPFSDRYMIYLYQIEPNSLIPNLKLNEVFNIETDFEPNNLLID